jgi:hypothetical protein
MRAWSVRSVVCTGLKLALIGFSPLSLFSQLAPYGSCQTPAKEGVNICAPSGIELPSPVQVIATGTSGRGQVQFMELWVDGKKLMQTPGSPFNEPVTLSPGNHTFTVVELDDTGYFAKSAPFPITVLPPQTGPCLAPGTPGINVCDPAPNSCNTQPWVSIVATGKGASGTVSRMELWFDGTKIANFPGNRINTNFVMLGMGTITIWEVDSKGASLSTSLQVSGPC